jgi:hypothetical protein
VVRVGVLVVVVVVLHVAGGGRRGRDGDGGVLVVEVRVVRVLLVVGRSEMSGHGGDRRVDHPRIVDHRISSRVVDTVVVVTHTVLAHQLVPVVLHPRAGHCQHL